MYCYIIQFEVDKTLRVCHRDTFEVSIALLTAASSTYATPILYYVCGMHVQCNSFAIRKNLDPRIFSVLCYTYTYYTPRCKSKGRISNINN